MVGWAVDLVLAVVVTGLEVAALALFWFRESLKAWAAQGRSVPGGTRRLVVVLGVGTALPGLGAVAFFEVGLKAAAVSQALMASVLGSILALGLATEAGRWLCRGRRKGGAER
ncbi:hypothetical protein [Streptomyces sp. AcE210]|uniref:hypothetical protein n=1 Tax=Streptomyces sp. AcE210 TaxID=2292703 RepID=UPI000E30724D|nr:hypothetical protein [Streptomyces sp. AcE210]RFC69980.1 hypothetical protein DXZ75_21405 [Streptomyces sp. AcE210]